MAQRLKALACLAETLVLSTSMAAQNHLYSSSRRVNSLHGYHAHIWYTYIRANRTLIHMKQKSYKNAYMFEKEGRSYLEPLAFEHQSHLTVALPSASFHRLFCSLTCSYALPPGKYLPFSHLLFGPRALWHFLDSFSFAGGAAAPHTWVFCP